MAGLVLGGVGGCGGPRPWPERPRGPCGLQEGGPLKRSPPPSWCPEPGVLWGFSGQRDVAHPSLPVFRAAEKVSSLGKDWHKFCLKCERCNKTLTPGGHAEVRAAGAGGVRDLCCHAGLNWWPLQHLRGGESPQSGWGGGTWCHAGGPCGVEAREHTPCLPVLLLPL